MAHGVCSTDSFSLLTSTNHVNSYGTSRYRAYKPGVDLDGIAPIPPFSEACKYCDDYYLYMNIDLTPNNVHGIPTRGVRLDDHAVGCVLQSQQFTVAELARNWPAEFDQMGMVRPTRCPLGNAFKIHAHAKTKDMYGNVIEGAGWYYGWWRGLHCLMGHEGEQAGLYWVRPSFEHFKAKGMAIKAKSACVIQEPIQTPASCPGYQCDDAAMLPAALPDVSRPIQTGENSSEWAGLLDPQLLGV